MMEPIPVVLFAYCRPTHLARALACLRENRVPLLYVFSDGPARERDEPVVAEVRELLRGIDWCETVITEREENLGLGRSILAGVTSVLNRHEAAIIVEDDLVFVAGTYTYICAALGQYRHEPKVMSVAGWNHPTVTPQDVSDQPYFDGRAECWLWATWARAWAGMDVDAKTKLEMCKAAGIDVFRYGAGLPRMAEIELEENIWAVRFLYHQILHRGLCLRPPHSMVEHMGFDNLATNACDGENWRNPPLGPCPQIPECWPLPEEHPDCPALWQESWKRQPHSGGQVPAISLARVGRFVRRCAGFALRCIRGYRGRGGPIAW